MGVVDGPSNLLVVGLKHLGSLDLDVRTIRIDDSFKRTEVGWHSLASVVGIKLGVDGSSRVLTLIEMSRRLRLSTGNALLEL